MILYFDRLTLKSAVESAKSVATTRDELKKVAYLYIEDTRMIVYSISEDRTLEFAQSVLLIEPNTIGNLSLKLNPYEFEAMFKGMGRIPSAEVHINVNDNTLTMNEKTISISNANKPLPDLDNEFSNIDIDEFLDKFSIVGSASGKSSKAAVIDGRSLMLFAPTYSKRIHLDIDLDPREILPDKVKTIIRNMKFKKSDEKRLSKFDSLEHLVLKFETFGKNRDSSIEKYFFIKSESKVSSKRLELNEVMVNPFTVNAEDFMRIASSYKAKVEEVYINQATNNGNVRLNIDPYEMGSELRKQFNVDGTGEKEFDIAIEGDVSFLGEFKVRLESLKALLSGYTGNVEVLIEEFEQKNDTCHLFSIKNEEMLSSLVIKNKPDYDIVQKKLDEIIKRQSTYRYLE